MSVLRVTTEGVIEHLPNEYPGSFVIRTETEVSMSSFYDKLYELEFIEKEEYERAASFMSSRIEDDEDLEHR